jgi:hypothetical protein
MRLYRYHRRSEIVEVVETGEGASRLLEVTRHPDELLRDLLIYADQVQQGVDAPEKPKTAKCSRKRRAPGDNFKRRTAGGGQA